VGDSIPNPSSRIKQLTSPWYFPMTHSSEKPSMATGTKVLIGSAIGCGCLMFAIIPIGILAAIALPSFLNQANKAKESEAKQYVGTIVRAEQAYFLENQKFTEDLAQLGSINTSNSVNYTYSLKRLSGKNQSLVMVQATPKAAVKDRLKTFSGAARAVGNPKDATTEGIVCYSLPSGQAAPFVITSDDKSPLECPASMQSISK
jgi:type IV pilus assembly protein PilA